VGVGHSGTTLLLRMLNEHPNLFSIKKETYCFVKKDIKCLFKYQEMALKNNKKRIVEKTPKHLFYIKNIKKRFPDSVIIGMVRNGEYQIPSLMKRNKSQLLNKYLNLWIDGVTLINKNCDVVVKMEDLINDPIKTSTFLLDFLNEADFDLTNYHTKNWVEEYNKKEGKKLRQIEDKSKLSSKHYYKRMGQMYLPLYNSNIHELKEEYRKIIKNNKKFTTLMKKLNYLD